MTWVPLTACMHPLSKVDGVNANQTLTMLSTGESSQYGVSWCQQTSLPVRAVLTKKSDDHKSISGPIAASTMSSKKGLCATASTHVETKKGFDIDLPAARLPRPCLETFVMFGEFSGFPGLEQSDRPNHPVSLICFAKCREVERGVRHDELRGEVDLS